MKKNMPMLIMTILLVLSVAAGLALYFRNGELKETHSLQAEQLREVKRQLEAADREVASLRRGASRSSEELERALGERETASRSGENLQGELGRLREAEGRLKAQIALGEDELRRMSEKMATEQEASADRDLRLREEILALEEKLSGARAVEEKLKAAVASGDKRVAELTGQVARLTERSGQTGTAHRRAMDGLKGELSEARASEGRLETLLRESEGRLSAAAERNAELEAEAAKREAAHRESLLALKGKVTAGDTRLQALEERLAAAGTTIATLREELRTKENRLLTLKEASSETRALLEERESVLKTRASEIERLRVERGSIGKAAGELKQAYDALVREFRQEIQDRDTVIREYEKKLSVTFLDRVIFESAAVEITPEGRRTLDKAGNILKRIRRGRIRIAGHTDNVPIRPRYQDRFPTNWELSAARAAAVARFFEAEANISPKKREISGHAFYKPVSGNDTAKGRSANRRVEITVVPAIEFAVF